MAHELEILSTGEAAGFFVKKKPWHELGTILDSPPTVIEGIQAAGLDTTVVLQSIQTDSGLSIEGRFATVREHDNKILGVVGSTYQLVQNIEAFNWFQPFLDEGVAELESAGSLFDGKKIWVLAKIKGENLQVTKSDEIERYILLSNSHDGSSAVSIGFTPIRVVCNNTLQMASDCSVSQLIRIFHTSKVQDTMKQVRDIMNVTNSSFEATVLEYQALTKKDINTADLKRYIKRVFHRELESEQSAFAEIDEIGQKGDGKLVSRVIELFETGRGAELPGVRGTYWGAYNSVIEYLQYERGKDPNRRFSNLWFANNPGSAASKALRFAVAA